MKANPTSQSNSLTTHVPAVNWRRAFGNADFAQPTPRDLVVYIVEHHDEGWAPIDALREQSSTTGHFDSAQRPVISTPLNDRSLSGVETTDPI